MRARLLIGAVAVAVLASVAPQPAFAVAPRYVASAAISATRADVGTTITVSGRVWGRLAAKKRIYLQRKVGADAWSTVGSTRTSAKRAYVFRHVVTTAGAQSFRVYVPRSRKARAGLSTEQSMTGWRWLYFTEQSVTVQSYGSNSNNWIYTGAFATADGVSDPHSYRLLINPSNAVVLSAQTSHCERVAATISTTPASGPVTFQAYGVTPAQNLTLSPGANQLLNLPLNPMYDENSLALIAPAQFASVVVAGLRQYCSVNAFTPY